MGNNIQEIITGNEQNEQTLNNKDINPAEYKKYLDALSSIKDLIDQDKNNPSLKIDIIKILESIKGIDRITDSLIIRYISSLTLAGLGDIQGIVDNLNSSIGSQILEIKKVKAKYSDSKKLVLKSGKWLNELQSSYAQITTKEELDNFLYNLKGENNNLSEKAITEIMTLAKDDSSHGEDWFWENDFMDDEVDRGEIKDMTINNLRTIAKFLQNENKNENLSMTLPGSNEEFEFANLADKLQFINIFLTTLNDGLGDENKLGIFMTSLFVAGGVYGAYKILPKPFKWLQVLFKGMIKITPILNRFGKSKDLVLEGGEDKVEAKEVNGKYISKEKMLDYIEKVDKLLNSDISPEKIKLYDIKKLVTNGVISDITEIQFGKLLRDPNLPDIYNKSIIRLQKVKAIKLFDSIRGIGIDTIPTQESIEIETYLKELKEGQKLVEVDIFGENYKINKIILDDITQLSDDISEIERITELENEKIRIESELEKNKNLVEKYEERIMKYEEKTIESTISKGKNTIVNPEFTANTQIINETNAKIDTLIETNTKLELRIIEINPEISNLDIIKETIVDKINEINSKIGGESIEITQQDLSKKINIKQLIKRIISRIKI